jgi:hypothetical protein
MNCCSFCQTENPGFTEKSGGRAFCGETCQTGFYDQIGLLVYNPDTDKWMPPDLIIEQLMKYDFRTLWDTLRAFPELKNILDTDKFEVRWLNSYTRQNSPYHTDVYDLLDETDISSERKMRILFVLGGKAPFSTRLIRYALQYPVYRPSFETGKWLIARHHNDLFFEIHQKGLLSFASNLHETAVQYKNLTAFKYLIEHYQSVNYVNLFVYAVDHEVLNISQFMLETNLINITDGLIRKFVYGRNEFAIELLVKYNEEFYQRFLTAAEGFEEMTLFIQNVQKNKKIKR